ncbi:MAG: hypothetical protein NZT61_03105 [Deltaproteobacteria bacterium]|nr:hypothetical protein [Deltaproteobacteria bacterium]MCX7952563.1 hypothetical protein [Deltaproteobacteria bacterium]
MRKLVLIGGMFLVLGIDSCSEDYEFCPNCSSPTPTPTQNKEPTETPTSIPATPSPQQLSMSEIRDPKDKEALKNKFLAIIKEYLTLPTPRPVYTFSEYENLLEN